MAFPTKHSDTAGTVFPVQHSDAAGTVLPIQHFDIGQAETEFLEQPNVWYHPGAAGIVFPIQHSDPAETVFPKQQSDVDPAEAEFRHQHLNCTRIQELIAEILSVFQGQQNLDLRVQQPDAWYFLKGYLLKRY
jgi:hypothetical protein